MHHRLTLCTTLLACALLLLPGCNDDRPTDSAEHVHLTVALERPPTTVDPVQLMDIHSQAAAAAVHAPLLLVDEHGQQHPVIAESLEMADDGLTCTIRLREAAFWDGSDVTASDVAASLTRLRASEHPHRWVLDRVEGVEAFDNSEQEAISGFAIQDERTLEVRFSEPDVAFPAHIAMSIAAIVKEGSDASEAKPLDTHVVGCGPFRPADLGAGTRLRLERNPGYPFESDVAELTLRVVDNPQNAIQLIARGDIQLMRVRGPSLGEVFHRDDAGELRLRRSLAHLTPLTAPANELTFLRLNWESSALGGLGESERRQWAQQLSAALPRDTIANQLYLGLARPATSIVPPSVLAVDTVVAGLDGDVTPPSARLTMLSANDPDSRRLAAFVQSRAQSLGVELDLQTVELSQLVPRMLEGTNDLYLVWIEQAVPGLEGGGPIPWLQFFTKTSPLAAFGQPLEDVAEAQTRARGLVDSSDQQEAYRELVERIDRQQSSWVPIASRDAVYLADEGVDGLLIDANGILYYAFLGTDQLD